MGNVAAYAAGLFDGEGCVAVYKVGAKRAGIPGISLQLQVVIGMSDPEPLEFLQKCYGGHIQTCNQAGLRKRIFYRWALTQGQSALDFLEDILPYSLGNKLDQIQEALKYPLTDGSRPLPDEVLTKRQLIKDILHSLKEPRYVY